MAETLRIGLIGYGFASKTFHAPLIAGTPGARLAMISSSDAAKVHADWPDTPVVADAAALINDDAIDLVVIPTPNDTHFPLAKQALQAGKHVVVDKPFTVTLSQAQELSQLAASRNLVLSVFHNRRWDSDFLTVAQLIKEGQLGDICYFESHFDRYRPEIRSRWREQPGAGSGIWYDLGPHLIDQALALFGMPVAMDVDMARLRPGALTTDYFHAQLIYPARRVILHASMLTAADSPRFIIHGTRGSFVKYGLDPQEDRLKAGERPPRDDWGVDTCEGVLTLATEQGMTREQVRSQPGQYQAYYQAVVAAIEAQTANPVTPEEAIAVMQLIELGIASAEQKKTLPVRHG